jgi:adiponectin receptor
MDDSMHQRRNSARSFAANSERCDCHTESITCEECHTPVPYILTGYRPEGTIQSTIPTLFSLHNETCNIWTHLVPLFGVIGMLIAGYPSLDWVTQVYLITVAICFALSTLYHLFVNVDLKTAQLLGQLDKVGILTMLWGSNFPMIMYGFACFPDWQKTYLAVGTSLVGLILFSVVTRKLPEHIAIGAFVLLIFYGWGQAFHEYFIHAPPSSRSDLVVLAYARSFSCYVAGFLFFVSHFPERWFPKTFDLCGCSHNFWHIATTVGAYMQYLNALDYYKANTCRA